MLLIVLDGDVFAFDEPSVIQALPKGIDNKCEAGSRGASEKSDHGIGCCARATSGHAAAAQPSSVMNSRRLNRSNCIRSPPATYGLQDIELQEITQRACLNFVTSLVSANNGGPPARYTFA